MNILLLSSIYPIPDPQNQGTKVCHFFAKEWVGMGHNVTAIHYQATYPAPFYWAAKMFQKKLAAKTGAVIYTKREKKPVRFEMDGVDVLRIPLFKPMPHGRFSKKRIKKSVETIISHNKQNSFVPDLIVGHFLNPQLEVLNILKEKYKHAKLALVFHLPAEVDMAEKIYKDELQSLYSNIDVFGFRNEPLKRIFESKYGLAKKSFICYSGIPENYIVKDNPHHFKGIINKFIYVGGLIERKYPSQVLEALHISYPDGNFKLNYVGDGQQKVVIEKKIVEYQLAKSVTLHGKIDRDRILRLYDQSDCMVMISKGEAYGLVYLEAMARGCITIASSNEGMDGVIIDGYNGFLCPAGNVEKLTALIKRINALSDLEKERISMNAIKTAGELTDHLAAQRYLNDVIE